MILDLFAGPGGWSEGLRSLGFSDVGIEWNAAACSTRRAAGHETVEADVATSDPSDFAGVVGLIASPPCQDWSRAGGKAKRDGKSGFLVDEVPRWVDALRPEWVACEQTPLALPVWLDFAETFASWGYSTWVGKITAADFGVPQVRVRAVLVASRVREVSAPDVTHSKDATGSLFDAAKPWVTMAEALGWTAVDPWWLDRRNDQTNCVQLGEVDPRWPLSRPATTIAGRRLVPDPGANANRFNGKTKSRNDGYKVTLEEAAILQGFRAGYPWQGTETEKMQQIGDAVPPPMAAAVVKAARGSEPAEVVPIEPDRHGACDVCGDDDGTYALKLCLDCMESRLA